MNKFLFLILVLASVVKAEEVTYVSDKSLWTVTTPLSQLTGLVLPDDWQQHADFVPPTVSGPLPTRFDWREQVAKSPAIVNQGNCGSCWAFGTTAIMNWAYAIKGVNVDLAEQEILSCSGKGSCRGGYFAHAYQYSPGASLESEFKYQARDLRCKKGLSHRYKIKRWAYVGQANKRPTVEEIKRAISEYGPVAVTVTANSKMQSYRGGVFNGCTNGGTNHIVHLLGWNDSEGTWLLGNSWGKTWGEQGYMRIKYGCSRVGEIASFVVVEPL